jgi:hypothetical protein
MHFVRQKYPTKLSIFSKKDKGKDRIQKEIPKIRISYPSTYPAQKVIGNILLSDFWIGYRI